MSSITNQIHYYVRENETTKRFFNPKLLIVPGGYFLLMILITPIDVYTILGIMYILVIEWLILYLMIVLEKLQTIISNQERIMTLLEKKG